MNLHDIAFPQLARSIAQVHVWLDKAEASAAARKYDPQVLLTSRLAPDQWPLVRQIYALCAAPIRLAALLQGVTQPDPPELAPTMAAARARVDETLTAIRALDPEQFRGAEERVFHLPFLPGKGMQAAAYVLQFSLPNFYFHATTAYAILRHNGVEVGKIDFIGPIELLDV